MTQIRMPPGPPLPRAVQALIALTVQNQTLPYVQRRYGDVFTVSLPVLGKAVVVADPELARQIFRADPKVLHAGSQSPLRAVLGRHSLLAIDEDYHLSQRKLLLPPFHGERMKGYEAIIEDEAVREMATWPADTPFATLPSFTRITLNAIIRSVFGAQEEDADDLRRLLPAIVARGSRLALMPFLHRDLGAWSPWGRFVRLRAQFDAVVDRLIERARADSDLEARSDVLAMLVQATHEDGSPMHRDVLAWRVRAPHEAGSPMHRDEIADEMLTLLAAGHETTAATLAWAVERLRRHPAIVARLAGEIEEEGGGELRDATIREVQRVRPTIAGVGRETTEPYALGEWVLPE